MLKKQMWIKLRADQYLYSSPSTSQQEFRSQRGRMGCKVGEMFPRQDMKGAASHGMNGFWWRRRFLHKNTQFITILSACTQGYLHPQQKKKSLLLVLPTQKIKYNSHYKCVCLNINEYHLWKLLMHPGRWSAHTYLMCLIPAILIPDAQFGMMIKECFTAGGLSPCQHSVVEWRQPPSVLVVRRCSQRQQSLHKRTAQT